MRTPRAAALLALGLALASTALAQQPELARPRRSVVQGAHERFVFDKEVKRVAIGEPDTASSIEISTRELLVLGKKPGQTTLIVWFADGTHQEVSLVVRRDLSLLQEALKEIHPAITADLAPDRDAVVLRGVVPDAVSADLAVKATQRYLSASTDVVTLTETAVPGLVPRTEVRETQVAVINMLRLDVAPEPLEVRLGAALQRMVGEPLVVRRLRTGAIADDGSDLFSLEGRVDSPATLARVLSLARRLVQAAAPEGAPAEGRVENLLRIDPTAPPSPLRFGGSAVAEDRITAAIRDIGGDGVTVRRLTRGTLPDDALDVFVLEGHVKNQVALVRILSVAARLFDEGDAGGGGQGGAASTIRVLANESGALSQTRGGQGGQGGGGGGGQGGGGQGGGGQGGGLFGGGGNQGLFNRVQQNVGRAKALSAAGGRLLSFIDVRDLPQVRVELRFFEVNRTKLEQFDLDAALVNADFPTNSLTPGPRATALEGAPTRVGSVSPTDVKNVVSFLNGTLGNELQIAGSQAALSATLLLLESEGLARTLSSPTLTVLSGEQAFFTVGGQIPIPVAFQPALGGDVGGANGVFSGVEFRDFGVQLGVRPLVGDDDVLTLDLNPQVIQPDPQLTAQLVATTGQAQQTTAFQTRSLQTSARLHDGQALLLGGLSTRERRSDSAYVPYLARIPLVEWLFQDTRDAENEQVLVVLVNPVIVRDPVWNSSLWAFPDARELMRGVARDRAVRRGRERKGDGEGREAQPPPSPPGSGPGTAPPADAPPAEGQPAPVPPAEAPPAGTQEAPAAPPAGTDGAAAPPGSEPDRE